MREEILIEEQRESYWKNKGSVIFKGDFFSYADLNGKIITIYRELVKRKISKGTIVAIYMRRNEWTVALIWSLLKQGIPFLPLDIALPEKRRQYMLAHLNIQVVFTEEIYEPLFSGMQMIFCDRLQGEGLFISEKDFEDLSTEEDTAYYLYTSGTTGEPKAVEVSQRALRNFIDGIMGEISFQTNQHIASFTAMSFDIFLMEVLVALKVGMCIVLSAEGERMNPTAMKRLIREHHVQVLQITPSHLQILLTPKKDFTVLEGIELLLLGGEMFPEPLLKELQEKTHCRIFNMYGPTEATIWVSAADLTEEKIVHIGKPIKNTEIYILDEKYQPVSEGKEGEICIAGRCLANGYKNNKEITEQKFIYAPFSPGKRLYCTGDVGKVENGNFYCLGRADNQIKYLGHRIELEEIENKCKALLPVGGVAAFFIKEANAQYISILYEAKEGSISSGEVMEKLKTELPNYMLPKYCLQVESLALTVNGKVDRKYNYEKYLGKDRDFDNYTDRAKGSELKNRIINIIQANLKLKEIEEKCRIKDLPMNSLDFVNIITEIEEIFHITFEEEKFFEDSFETIQDMIDYVSHLLDTGSEI